ncbi:hypothetical protein SpCBS45565_g02786 [Spizellomyces sp. 'palustris']|nr:hypothetical protein SpCBS45565_g02786 [Spizellomyces sp. 'palustris']
MPRRPPPGGHTSIVFGDDTTSVPWRSTSQAAAADARTPPPSRPTTPPKTATEPWQGRKNKSTVFGNDTQDVADGIDKLSISKKSGRSPGGQSSMGSILSTKEKDAKPSAPTAPSPSRPSGSIVPLGEDERIRRPAKRQLGDPGHRSSVALGSQTPSPPPTRPQSPTETPRSKPASLRVSSPGKHFQSSITFGDDDPPQPEFSPRKHKPGRRNLAPPGGGSSSLSLAEFAGGVAVDTTTSPKRERVDPASISGTAGRTTGKHRIY